MWMLPYIKNIWAIFLFFNFFLPFFFTFFSFQGNELKLTDMFFNPEKLHEPGMIDDLIRGMSTTSMETLDQFITDEVTKNQTSIW